MHRNLHLAWFAVVFSSVFSGCVGRPPMQQGYQPYGQPQYLTVPTASPENFAAPGPVTSPLPRTAPPPIASPPPGATSPDGGIILTPAARTSAWYAPRYPTWRTPATFAPMAAVPPGPRYADVGRYIDGRPFAGSRSSVAGSGGGGVLIPMPSQILAGMKPTPGEDLKYRGGKAIKDLTYINIYVGGNQAWSESDRKNIDWALNGAMTDPNLNHVLMQYFNDQPVTASYRGSFILDGYRPLRVTQANLRELVKLLHARGSFSQLPLETTAINFFLPRGVILEDPDSGGPRSTPTNGVIPSEGESSSLLGLGGYHGSVHIGQETLYYSAGVYSERMANGQTNGVPVFNVPWKDTCAMMYHVLQEIRTDPDVDDALVTGQEQYLGWVSGSGEEISDFPVEADGADGRLDQVFVEVPLANGSGRVPVQLCYSNAVHGPEGPITKPHRGAPLPIPPASPPPPGASPPTPAPPSNPPPSNPPPTQPNDGGFDPGLEWINKEWDFLPESVKAKILQLIKDAH